MKKVTLNDGTEIEVLEQSDIESAIAVKKKEWDDAQKADADKKAEDEAAEAAKKDDDEGKKEEDPFIASLKAERKSQQEKQLQAAAKGNADLEKAIQAEMKAFENSALSFDDILAKATSLAVVSNPDKNFQDIIGGTGSGNKSFHDGGANGKREVSSAVRELMLKSGSTPEELEGLIKETNV